MRMFPIARVFPLVPLALLAMTACTATTTDSEEVASHSSSVVAAPPPSVGDDDSSADAGVLGDPVSVSTGADKTTSTCACDVQYTGYTDNGISGTLDAVSASDGAILGADADGRYLITMGVDLRSLGFTVEYKQYLGFGSSWSAWYTNGAAPVGYTGSPVKGIQIQLVGAPAQYHIQYSVRIEGQGWQAWVQDGATAWSPEFLSLGYRNINAVKVRIAGPARTQCSIGGFDGANCYVGTPPAGTSAFLWGNNFYYTPLPGNNCPYKPFSNSGFDGANCFVTPVPTCANPFIWSNNWYVTPIY